MSVTRVVTVTVTAVTFWIKALQENRLAPLQTGELGRGGPVEAVRFRRGVPVVGVGTVRPGKESITLCQPLPQGASGSNLGPIGRRGGFRPACASRMSPSTVRTVRSGCRARVRADRPNARPNSCAQSPLGDFGTFWRTFDRLGVDRNRGHLMAGRGSPAAIP